VDDIEDVEGKVGDIGKDNAASADAGALSLTLGAADTVDTFGIFEIILLSDSIASGDDALMLEVCMSIDCLSC
jgi:hypothetical protein